MTLDMESVFRRKVEEKEEKMVRTSKEEEEKLKSAGYVVMIRKCTG